MPRSAQEVREIVAEIIARKQARDCIGYIAGTEEAPPNHMIGRGPITVDPVGFADIEEEDPNPPRNLDWLIYLERRRQVLRSRRRADRPEHIRRIAQREQELRLCLRYYRRTEEQPQKSPLTQRALDATHEPWSMASWPVPENE